MNEGKVPVFFPGKPESSEYAVERIYELDVQAKHEAIGYWVTFTAEYTVPMWIRSSSDGGPGILHLTPEEFAAVHVGDRFQVIIRSAK